MVAAKSVPQNNPDDLFESVLRPPLEETPAERDARIRAEQNAKRVSDAIDEQLRSERADLKRNRVDVKILLLGQSESGKSTTLKRMYSIIPFPPCPVIKLRYVCLSVPAVRAGHTNTHSSRSSRAHTSSRVPAPPHPRSLPGRASSMAYRYLSQPHPFRPEVRSLS
jgi:hypothetical protein